MCFYNEHDWSADVYEVTDGPADTEARCHECSKPIAAGEWRSHIWMQQYEECRDCEQLGKHDDDCEHDYGETDTYVCCEACRKLREVVREVELAEGCSGNEAEPPLGGLYEDLNNVVYQDRESLDRYLKPFVEKYPAFARNHPQIDRLVAINRTALAS